MTLNTQETATVLAALRYWQHNVIRHQIEPTDIPYEYHDHFAGDRPLVRREIDALCERINLGEAPKTFVMTNINDGNDQTELEATEYNAAVQEALEMAGYAVLSHDEVAEHMGEDLEGEEDEETH